MQLLELFIAILNIENKSSKIVDLRYRVKQTPYMWREQIGKLESCKILCFFICVIFSLYSSGLLVFAFDA